MLEVLTVQQFSERWPWWEELFGLLVVVWGGARDHLFERDGELVRVERAPFRTSLRGVTILYPGLHDQACSSQAAGGQGRASATLDNPGNLGGLALSVYHLYHSLCCFI